MFLTNLVVRNRRSGQARKFLPVRRENCNDFLKNNYVIWSIGDFLVMKKKSGRGSWINLD